MPLSALLLDLALLAAVLLPLAGTYLAGGLLQQPEGRDPLLSRRYAVLILRGWVVTVLLLLVWRAQGLPLARLGLPWPPQQTDLIAFILVAVGLLVLPVQLWRLAELPPDQLAAAVRQIDAIKITPNSWGELALFVLVSITAGVWEELVYRGFLIWYFAPSLGLIGAVIASALLFGLGHAYQGAGGMISTATLGLTFALLYLASGSLWWLMAIHAAIDIQTGFVAFRVKHIAGQRRQHAAEIVARMRQGTLSS